MEAVEDTFDNAEEFNNTINSTNEDESTDPEELTLPRQTVAKLVQELMPSHYVCPRDTRDLLVACCTEFVHLLTSEANEACERSSKKTISPDHLLEALRNLGMGEYCGEVEAALGEVQEAARVRAARQQKGKAGGEGGDAVGEEELARQQAELFEQAKQKYLASKQQQR